MASDLIMGLAAFGPSTDCATPVAGASAMHVLPVDNDILRRRIAALEADLAKEKAENARMREALGEAKERILTLAHARGAEVEASDAELTGFIDAAIL